MGSALSLWRTYRLLVGARVRSQLQYRTSLALELLATALLTFLDFVAILIIFEQVPALAGWSVAEVALLYGIASLAFSLTDLVVGHLDFLSQMIRDGSFDQVLTRPLPSLLQVITADFAVRRRGEGRAGARCPRGGARAREHRLDHRARRSCSRWPSWPEQ